ncbi:MAG: nuclease [Gemmatimonadetes bacterium]|nr:nuclease [Gemmatimonadota bacterium]
MRLLTTVLIAAAAASPAHATGLGTAGWGAMGHRLVVEIAWDYLTPTARASAVALLGGQSIGSASVWADSIRGSRRETGPMHYVNLPAGERAWHPERYCRNGDCVVGAVEKYQAILADRSAPTADRAEALRFVMHFVGDMHQPLHVGDRGDRGGNDVAVTWRDRKTNLHSVWDTDLLRAWAPSEGNYLRALRRRVARMSPAERDQAASGSVVGWAMDGNATSGEVAYRLPPGNALGPEYLRSAGPVMDLAIIHAGLRLARLLNQALDG